MLALLALSSLLNIGSVPFPAGHMLKDPDALLLEICEEE